MVCDVVGAGYVGLRRLRLPLGLPDGDGQARLLLGELCSESGKRMKVGRSFRNREGGRGPLTAVPAGATQCRSRRSKAAIARPPKTRPAATSTPNSPALSPELNWLSPTDQ